MLKINNLNTMKTTLIYLVCFVLASTDGFSKQILFGNALKSKSITYQVTSEILGNRRMKLNIQNNATTANDIQLETGRIFLAENNDVQPFVVTNGYLIHLEPNEARTLWVQARCGNSGA